MTDGDPHALDEEQRMTDVATERHDAGRPAGERADAAASARLNRAMMQRDLASASLGMVVERDDPGHAVVSMRVREDMTNGFAITHGGLVFTLADTAFAIACNEDHQVTVAAGADITFLKSTVAGQTLTATAVRRARSGRTGLYDVTVVDEQGDAVAEFRGRSITTNRTL
ncbi:hydroxyphenylacetyl-CoA thioesterase PaaI [Agromyces indicus]|uniref:Hydroxyphenylacetyl-CoA thioesterase PaaI n=1 Tax=Agromyces indicus TaxID=758919 RepID=A0ABU1FM54_9MICO|nr:hydroxyphenylacetyl-CoA thioesterase PaaI [Agromyces indicus]MDR5692849.1 hydroxyphenylacetyl-CoA thioesterase PaaI [Agromyces indicus]